MRKLLIALALGLLLVAALATVASADNGPHGGFNGSTDACASCHRAHSGKSADGMLLVASDIYTLCTNCHDGTGAYTNVVNGYYDTNTALGTDLATTADPGKTAFAGGWGDANHGLFGGGFVTARMLTDYGNASNEGGLAAITTNAVADRNTSLYSWARWNKYDTTTTAPLSRAVTSNHDVSTVARTGTVWGSGNIDVTGTLANNWKAGSFTGATELECTSCHDPHGNAGKQGGLSTGVAMPSYRLLRFQPEGSNGFEVTGGTAVGAGTGFFWNTSVVPDVTGVLVPDTATKWYSVNNDITLDPSLIAYRGRAGGGEILVAIFAGQGDYMGRYYGYQRPAAVAAAGTNVIDCPTNVANPTNATPPNAPSITAANACGAATGTAFNNLAAHDKLGYWCATCHDRYLAPGGASRNTDSGDPGYHYRHRSQDNKSSAGLYTCVDCHNAHGTAATASSTLASNASYAFGSVLLKGDNRALCTRCHAGAVNFFNVTTSPNAPQVVLP